MRPSFTVNGNIGIGDAFPLLIIAGPCVIENEALCLEIAHEMKEICDRLGLGYIFKASFDKANRSSITSFRGPGLEKGLRILERIRYNYKLPVITDIHEIWQVKPVAEIVDIIQIPAFLSRQTDLLCAAAETGSVINVKKGQFLAPTDMRLVIEKIVSTGNEKVILTERGTSFGYKNLVVDMRSIRIMRDFSVPVVFDATHSVQLPGVHGDYRSGRYEFIGDLIRAAVAVGIDGLFLETHPTPDKAQSDGANMLPLDKVESILRIGRDIHGLCRESQSD